MWGAGAAVYEAVQGDHLHGDFKPLQRFVQCNMFLSLVLQQEGNAIRAVVSIVVVPDMSG